MQLRADHPAVRAYRRDVMDAVEEVDDSFDVIEDMDAWAESPFEEFELV